MDLLPWQNNTDTASRSFFWGGGLRESSFWGRAKSTTAAAEMIRRDWISFRCHPLSQPGPWIGPSSLPCAPSHGKQRCCVSVKKERSSARWREQTRQSRYGGFSKWWSPFLGSKRSQKETTRFGGAGVETPISPERGHEALGHALDSN